MGFLRPQALDDEAWLEHFVTELRALQEDLGGASPLGDDAALRELAAFYLTYARDLIDERKYADVPAPAPRGSFAALAARASRDARNSREERVRNGLVAFARGSNGGSTYLYLVVTVFAAQRASGPAPAAAPGSTRRRWGRTSAFPNARRSE